MRPADLLACQADLVRKFEDHDFCDIIIGSMSGPYLPREAFAKVSSGLVRVSRSQRERWRERVPYWVREEAAGAMQNWARYGMAIEVTEHMVDLINWVANDFAELDTVDLDLMPSPYGLVHFAKPVKSIDVHGEELWTDWMLWGPVAGQSERITGVMCFNDLTAPDPQAVIAMQEAATDPALQRVIGYLGRWAYSSFVSVVQDDRMGPAEWSEEAIRKDYLRSGLFDENRAYRIVPTRNLARFVYAVWTVMNQPIAVLEQKHVDRATKRRMERMKIPPAVTVVTLRRPENPHRHDEESHVQWQHHWYVRGHPRWQPYGPGRSERRLIWIGPHVKGNLDAPLKQSDKVYVVKR